VISWILFGVFLLVVALGMIQRRASIICGGVLGAFGALILAAYSPHPW
jgi:hypothetical protein